VPRAFSVVPPVPVVKLPDDATVIVPVLLLVVPTVRFVAPL